MNHRVHGTESAIHFIDTNTIAFKGNKGTNDHIASHCLSSLFQYKKKKQVTRQQLSQTTDFSSLLTPEVTARSKKASRKHSDTE